jgi:hypothetical protein
MLITLNIIFAALVVAGIVSLFVHAIRAEHRERLAVAAPLHHKVASTHRSVDHRVAGARVPAPAA